MDGDIFDCKNTADCIGTEDQASVPYQFTVEEKPTYLHVTGAGDMTENNARRFLSEAYRASVQHNCDSLLLEMKFSGPLDLPSIYSVIEERSSEGALLRRIAYVNGNSELPPEAAEFAELLAISRGVNVRLFHSVTEAEDWLLPQSSVAARRSAV